MSCKTKGKPENQEKLNKIGKQNQKNEQAKGKGRLKGREEGKQKHEQ